MIALKILSIFALDISLIMSGHFISVIVVSHFFGTTLIQLIIVNIREAIGQQIPLAIQQIAVYTSMDFIISGVFFIAVLLKFIDNSLKGFIICLSAHMMVTYLIFIQVAYLKKQDDNAQMLIKFVAMEFIIF